MSEQQPESTESTSGDQNIEADTVVVNDGPGDTEDGGTDAEAGGYEGYGNETVEEIRRKGMFGVYHGCNIITLKNYKDEDGTPYIPNNELWVMARDTGKFAFFGGLKSKEFMELDNWYWHYLARRDTGIMVHHPERAQLLIDSNIS